MICEQCEFNETEEKEFICEDCKDKNLPIAEGDLPTYKVIDDQYIQMATACQCEDEMCPSCKQFQEMDTELMNIGAL